MLDTAAVAPTKTRSAAMRDGRAPMMESGRLGAAPAEPDGNADDARGSGLVRARPRLDERLDPDARERALAESLPRADRAHRDRVSAGRRAHAARAHPRGRRLHPRGPRLLP